MLELCPRGQEANEFFLFLFLQRLPKELRIMLGDDPGHDARALAAKADKLWAYHSHQQPNAVAAVAAAGSDKEEESQVAAVRGAAKGRPSGRANRVLAATRRGAAATERVQAPPPPPWRGILRASAFSTGGSATRRITVSLPAAGRETSDPGVSQRRRPWYTGSHRGRDHRKAFPCRYWRFF
jgi:hypothetical protein